MTVTLRLDVRKVGRRNGHQIRGGDVSLSLWPGEVMGISHDEAMRDRVADRGVEISAFAPGMAA
ncbi:hypothetical protein CLV78_10715 [Aliiruegeria haliotis]|uniref:Uncharacterized protein n=1 Tax=Aliiruegeria haliotis TaxID=1280846 RepID=A0A2T0RLT4_9RHOB|nr:hypothetical protein [Aliiruegeria haliotis]PRY22091.1 hypothetical protein CLV78_10715 [Aliiruegeria haliotis]